MALYRYVAMDSLGRKVQDVQDAKDEDQLSQVLKNNGLFLMEAVQIQNPAAAPEPAALPVQRPPPKKS